jgi:hypothetical protein
MAADEWLACTDPQKMLNVLRACGTASERKLRLFAAACCRRLWRWLPDERSQKAVDAAERMAEGLAVQDLPLIKTEAGAAAVRAEGRGAHARPSDFVDDSAYFAAGNEEISAGYTLLAASEAATAAWSALSPSPAEAAEWAAVDAAEAAQWAADAADWAAGAGRGRTGRADCDECGEQCRLLRCIFGPLPLLRSPFPSALLAWNDRCIVRLAQGIYQERAFTAERLGVLADALEEAGCTDADVLDHCRRPGQHARGCWVIDRILDRP